MDNAWQAIFDQYGIEEHDFSEKPYAITEVEIKAATRHFTKTGEREVRILCKQDTRESRPAVFKRLGLFLLPTSNGKYSIIQGEGYVNIPAAPSETAVYTSKLDFVLETSLVGNSEMQHLDFAYATSLIRTFMDDPSLVLTIRGRKFAPRFDFRVGQHQMTVQGVQTEVDAGYEGRNKVVLIEAKNSKTSNTIIRQLYYPLRQWTEHTKKPIQTLFFEKQANLYTLWHFEFPDPEDYNSISLRHAQAFRIITEPESA